MEAFGEPASAPSAEHGGERGHQFSHERQRDFAHMIRVRHLVIEISENGREWARLIKDVERSQVQPARITRENFHEA